MKEITRLPKTISNGIKNLIVWLPIIWSDRQWDNTFLYKILNKKLKLMEDFFYSDNTFAVDANKRAKQIQICRILTDRLLKDKYAEYAHKKIDKKWGKAQFLTKPHTKNTMKLDIVREKANTEKEKEKVSKEVMNASKTENEMIEQDLRLLFNIMRKNIRDWWD